MRRFLTNLCLSLFAVFLLNSCSETSSGNREFLQLFTATKDDPNRNELYAAYSDFTTERISGEMVQGGNVVEVAISPDGTQIAYVADQEVDEVYELFVVPANGGTPVKVSSTMVVGGDIKFNSTVENTSIQWSPDGSLISYVADQDEDNRNELYVVNPDGTSNIKVSGSIAVTGSDVFSFWSPDSSMIAYMTEQETPDVFELYVSQADGANNVKVSGVMGAGGSLLTRDVNWSPNSMFLSYVADQETDHVFELFVSTADGLSNNKVSGPLVAPAFPPSSTNAHGLLSNQSSSWSPNSDLIAYVVDQETENINEVYVSTPDGVSNIKISGPMVAAFTSGVSIPIQWAPNGQAISYIANQDTQSVYDLYVSTVDGLSNTRLSNTIFLVTDMEWSSDGLFIAYGANQDGPQNELFITSIDGTINRKISTTVRLNGSGASGPVDVEWSPDGNRVSYLYTNSTTRLDELHVANLESNESTRLTTTLARPRFDTRQAGGIAKKALWSPDSSRITYISRDITTGVQELFSSDFQSVFRLSGRMVLGGSVKTMHQ